MTVASREPLMVRPAARWAGMLLVLLAACGGDEKAGTPAAGTEGAAVTDTAPAADTGTAAPADTAAPPSGDSAAAAPDTAAKQQAQAPAPAPAREKPAPKPKPAPAPAAPPAPSKDTTATAQASPPAQENAPLRDAYHQAPKDTVDQDTYDGWKQFNLNCARCHGEDVLGTTIAPHLIVSLKPDGPVNTQELFMQIVCAGRPAKGMPAWCSLGMDPGTINKIYSYVKGRSEGKIGAGRPARKEG
jgi:Cytochrome C oxidase, cbb3-type, subunit III